MAVVRRRLLTLAEGVSWAVGLIGLAVWVWFQVGNATRTRHDLDRFAALQVEGAHQATPDQSLWSPARVSAWLKASNEPAPAPLCHFYKAASARVLARFALPAVIEVTSCRGMGLGGCVVDITLTASESAVAAPAMLPERASEASA